MTETKQVFNSAIPDYNVVKPRIITSETKKHVTAWRNLLFATALFVAGVVLPAKARGENSDPDVSRIPVTPTPELTSDTPADLIVTNLEVTDCVLGTDPVTGFDYSEVFYTATVMNQGSQSANNFYNFVDIAGDWWPGGGPFNLNPGQSQDISSSIVKQWIWYGNGGLKYTADKGGYPYNPDPLGNVYESNENNNSRSVAFTCGGPTPNKRTYLPVIKKQSGNINHAEAFQVIVGNSEGSYVLFTSEDKNDSNLYHKRLLISLTKK